MDIISFNEASRANERIQRVNANPDSDSGVVTVPKTIASGETITIPAGRVAVLPNVTVDGELVIEAGGEVFVPAGAGFSDLDQRIDTKLDKDFSSFTDKPTPDDTDNFALQETGGLSKKLSFANLMAWVKSFSFSWNQTWQNVTVSRSNGVTYTNNTGKPIMVVVCAQYIADSNARNYYFYIDEVAYLTYIMGSHVTGTFGMPTTFIVPNGSTYRANFHHGFSTWSELR